MRNFFYPEIFYSRRNIILGRENSVRFDPQLTRSGDTLAASVKKIRNMASNILEDKLRIYIDKSWAKYGRSNKLPKTVIGVESKNLKKVDKSGSVPKPLAQKLEVELIKIAPLGTPGHDNFVGCCCEVRSSNQILLIRSSISIKSLVFTDAKRPFSGQTIKRCLNCKSVFG